MCDGNVIAAQLLDHALLVTENRVAAGESEWYRRRCAYWVEALHGAASERTIRDAFKSIEALGLIVFRQVNGDQRGSFYKLNVERLQAEIDSPEGDPLVIEETRQKRQGFMLVIYTHGRTFS